MLSFDLLAVVVLVLVADLVFLTDPAVPVARVVLATLTVFLLPGYALIAVLFPRRSGADGANRLRRIDGIERLVLSVATSIVLGPLVILGVNFTPFGLEPVPIVVSLSATTGTLALLAAWRRSGLPSDQRYRVPIRRWVAGLRGRTDGGLVATVATVVVVVGLALSTAGVVWAIYERPPGETLTEFYVVTESEEWPGTQMGPYPETLTVGETTTLVVGVGNHEHASQEYTVVTSLQRVDTEAMTTTSYRELDRTSTPVLAHGQNWTTPVAITPTTAGDELRLTFALFRGEAPQDPAEEPAYREVHIWVDVTTE